MSKKQFRYLTSIILILFVHGGLYSQESVLYLGEEDLWNKTQLTNLSLIDGKRGFYDISCSDNEYTPDKDTDMIFSLNDSQSSDKMGNYAIMNQVPYISSKEAFGNGAAFFDGTTTLEIQAVENALFSPATLWDSFTIEFRMLPATLKEGATVFLWKGLHMKDKSLIPQEIRCTIHDRKLVWDFDNFFVNPDDTLKRISLSGDKLIPGMWSHHMISFNSETGLLEYRIDNIPSDNTYTTRTGNETNEFNIPLIGNQQSFPLELGNNYSGLIDELRISKSVIENPFLSKFSHSGFLETGIIDFKSPDSQLLRIETDSSIPQNTSIRFQYISANNKFDLMNPDLEWQEFTPFSNIDEKCRYLKIRAQFFSESYSGKSPVLSNISMIYRPSELPHPPLDLHAEKMDGNIKISWKKAINPAIKGYLLYFGEEPGEYFSTGSPIDAGNNNYINLEDLDNNKRYYFTVTSYKSLDPRLESIFSNEISISP